MPPRKKRHSRPRGSVYWHAASERWCAQTPPDRRGRRRSRYFGDEDAAWAWLDQQVAALDAGADVATGAEKLSAYLRRWLGREQANPDRDWTPNTVRTYTWAVERVEAHRHARTAVADLTRDHTDTLLADLADQLGRKSVGLIRSLLRSALADLVDDGVLPRNPVRRARPTRAHTLQQPNRSPWTEAEAQRFLATAFTHSQRPAIWWLFLSCGPRSGETRALELPDLDLASGTLTFRKTKARVPRTIELPANVAAALRDHLKRRQALGGPLFQARPGQPMSGETLLHELRILRRLAGVPPIGRVHDLRHVAASMMLANGYPITTTADILGHSPRTLLTTYAHAIPKHVVRAPRNIADVLPYPGQAPTAKAPAPAVRSAVPHLQATPSAQTESGLTHC